MNRVAVIVGVPLCFAVGMGVPPLLLRACRLQPIAVALKPATAARKNAQDVLAEFDRVEAELDREARQPVPQLAGRRATARPKLSAAGNSAYDELAAQSRFQGAAVGHGARMPSAVAALRVLVAEKNAALALRSLLTRASLPGQLYALSGLSIVDKERFIVEIEPYRALERRVRTQFGCSGGAETVAWLVSQIVNGWLPRELVLGHR